MEDPLNKESITLSGSDMPSVRHEIQAATVSGVAVILLSGWNDIRNKVAVRDLLARDNSPEARRLTEKINTHLGEIRKILKL